MSNDISKAVEEKSSEEPQQEPHAKKKRGADNQITKDDYNADGDDDEDADGDERLKQGFKRASDDVLKKRKIYQVKRPSSTSTATSTATATATNDSATTNKDESASTTSSSGGAGSASASASSSSNPFASASLSTTSSSNNPFASTVLTSSGTESKPASTAASSSGAEEKSAKESSPAKKKVFGFGAATGSNGVSGFGSGSGGSFAVVSGGFGSSSSTSGFGTDTGNKTSGFGGFGSSSTTTASNSAPKSFFGSGANSSITFSFSKGADSEPAAKGNENPANLPDFVDLKTGEEDEEAIHSGRCKAFEWFIVGENDGGNSAGNETDHNGEPAVNSAKNPSVQSSTQFQTTISTSESKDPSNKGGASDTEEGKWKELGTGPVKILKSKSRPARLRLVQRRESSKNGPATKVILNAPLWKESTCERDRQAQQYLHLKTLKDGKMCQFLLKFKESHDAGYFHHHLMEEIPLARRCFVPKEETK